MQSPSNWSEAQIKLASGLSYNLHIRPNLSIHDRGELSASLDARETNPLGHVGIRAPDSGAQFSLRMIIEDEYLAVLGYCTG